MWQERAARRDFKPDYVGFGSFSTEVSGACLATGVCFTPEAAFRTPRGPLWRSQL